MSQSTVANLRLSCPADLVAAAPYLVGFHPRDSLVVLALRGPRRRLALTMRLDLPDAGADTGQVVDGLVAALLRARTDHLALVVFGDRGDVRPPLPQGELVDLVADAALGHGIEVVEAVYCAAGRWWSYVCPDPGCCPVEGTATDASSRVAAAATYAGLVALPDRETLEGSLEPLRGSGATMRVALRGAARAAAGRSADPGERTRMQGESVRLLREAVDDEPVLSDEAAARLIVGLADLSVRDACCAWAQTPRNDPARRLWTSLARRAVRPFDAVPLAVLAWFAYLDGEATLASMAVRRCLDSDGDYSLALLLAEALGSGVDPAGLRGGLGSEAGAG